MKNKYIKMMEKIHLENELIDMTRDKMYDALCRKSISKTKVKILYSAMAASLTVCVCGTIYVTSDSKNIQSDSELYSKHNDISVNQNQCLLNIYSFDAEANKIPISRLSFNADNNEEKAGMIYIKSIDGNREELNLVMPLQIQYSCKNIEKIIFEINSGSILFPETPLTSTMLVRWQEVETFDNAVKTSKNVGKQLTINLTNETRGNLNVIWQSDSITADISKIEGYIGHHTFDFGTDLNITATVYFKDGSIEENNFTMDISEEGLSYSQ